MIALLLLAGCRTDCAAFDEMVITDPDGLLDEDGIDALYAARDAFAQAVDVDGVCVDEVVAVSYLEVDGHELAGSYNRLQRRIVVSSAYAGSFGRTLTHELCHGFDDVRGISAAHPELFDDAHGTSSVDPAIYDDPEQRQRERFADLCEGGPGQPAVTSALEELGFAGPEDLLLRDEVYTAAADLPVAVGGALAWEEAVAVTLPDKRESLQRGVVTGGRYLLETRAAPPLGVHLRELLPGEAAWGDATAMDVGRGYLWILAGLGNTDPTFVTGWGTERPVLHRWSDGEVTLVESPLTALAGDPNTTMSVDGDRAWWQTWGDGQPVQTGLLSTGEVEPYEPAGELALTPPLVLLPEGPVGVAYSAAPPWQEWWVFGDDVVSPVAMPRGVQPVGTLTDGTVVGKVSWNPDAETWCDGTALRDPEGAWWLPGDTICEDTGPTVVGGELYRIRTDGTTVLVSRASPS